MERKQFRDHIEVIMYYIVKRKQISEAFFRIHACRPRENRKRTPALLTANSYLASGQVEPEKGSTKKMEKWL